jgi:cytochrome c biogenesis protein CcmG/thiol:disulfide interchange protein DsbE
MKKNAKYIFPLILFIMVLIFLYRGLHLNPSEIQSPLIGKSAPNFSAPSIMDPKKTIDEKIFRDHITIFNVFASWCISCHTEHAQLMQLHKEAPDVQIIGLAFKDHSLDVKKYLQKAGNPYKAVVDDKEGNIGIDYGVYGTPETFVIDKGGVIRSKIVGPISSEILKNQLLPLIKTLNK